MAVAIEIKGLKTAFGKHVVHENLNLTIEEGAIVSIIGGSGTGKTTLLRQILGLEKPAAGEINVLGINRNTASSEELFTLNSRWGVLFQRGALFSALPVFDNIALPLRELRGLPEDLISDTVMLKLQMVGLAPADANKMPSDLSGGMIKRVALARSLALEPDLIFLDEPTSGLDPVSSDSFVELIQNLHDELNLTVVMVSHDLDTIVDISTQIVVLADRHVVASGPIETILSVKHPFIEEYFLGARGRKVLKNLPDYETMMKRVGRS
ncbi:MAG: ATP-binding cassette domain-containing protein [Oxalobacter sp.]|jgi:phospholipid/cholesterol/gamma-HCH transport system ATP-binding protein|nr:ATP-binding cassette domain-containing protein [Oxalobacter sp.]